MTFGCRGHSSSMSRGPVLVEARHLALIVGRVVGRRRWRRRVAARWAHIQSRRDPADRLASLQDDVAGAKAAIKVVLEGLAARHGIAARDVDEALEGYAESMLSDMIFDVERDLEREIEGEQ